ncbi:MAG: NAD(P)/FAD-dependent oxidoreductase [Methanocellales archaeon]
MSQNYDLIVVGGGPAGLSGAITAAKRGLRVVVFESGAYGGLLAALYPEKIIPNYPGFSGTARELVNSLLEEARSLGVELKKERVIEITEQRIVKTLEEQFQGKAILIATGARPKELGVPGEAEFNYGERGVYYYVSNPEQFKGKKVLVVGGGNTAIDAALDLANIASEVNLIHRRDKFRALESSLEKLRQKGNVKIFLNTELEEIRGIERVEKAVLYNSEKQIDFEVEVQAVVIAVGLIPNNEMFQKLGLKLDYEGRIKVDEKQKTNLSGIYAAGDIVAGSGKLELIILAVAQGMIAAHNAYLDIMQPYWK